MTGNEILSIIKATYPALTLDTRYVPGRIILLDNEYSPISEDHLERRWWELWVKESYIPERQDCDELAFQEMLRVRKRAGTATAPAIGVAGGVFTQIGKEMHAVNFYVHENKSLRLWDYQQQQIFFPRVDDVVLWMII